MSSSTTRIRCIASEPLAGEGRRQPEVASAPRASDARRRGRRRLPVLLVVPHLRALLEVLPALGVPRPGAVARTAPPAGAPEDPADHEEEEQEEQHREQEEPGE